MSLAHRDPAARTRLIGALTALVILWPLFQAAEVKPGALFDPANLKVIGNFLAAFLPPETGAEFMGYLAKATLETLAIATAGMALAFLIAVPMGYLATGAGREEPTLNPVTRSLLTILRGIPELVWALLFVRIFGLGPAAGVLALGLTYGGMLAKVYAEILESVDAAPARALRHNGAGRPLAILYGLIPQASKELASYTVYRWECAIRASVVMGFVGAGGLGQLMDQAMKMLNGGEAATILLAFMVLVFSADGLSGWLRRALDTPPANRALLFGWRSGVFGLALAISIVASFSYLEIGLKSMFTVEAARSIGEFVAGFFPPDLSADWLAKVAKGIWGNAGHLGRRHLACRHRRPAARPAQMAGAVQLPAQYPALGSGTGLGDDYRARRRPRPPSPGRWPWPCTPPACSVASTPKRSTMPRRRRPGPCVWRVRPAASPSSTAPCPAPPRNSLPTRSTAGK